MTGVPMKYYVAAVLVGILFAVGAASVMYKPQPVQVPLAQYQPAAPPAPAVPTIAPVNTVIPDRFAPAPAPVIVTTAPLPTITPVKEPTASPLKCNPNAWNTTNSCAMEEMNQTIATSLNLAVMILILLGVALMIGGFMVIGGPRP